MKKILLATIVCAGLLFPGAVDATTTKSAQQSDAVENDAERGSDKQQSIDAETEQGNMQGHETAPVTADRPLMVETESTHPTSDAPVQEPQTSTVPTFQIEAIGFTAVDETGLDILGSDEPYAIWESNDGAAASALFGDVDSGDTRYFHEFQRCIYPIGADRPVMAEEGDAWACRQEGGRGPIEFRVDMFEHDTFHPKPCFSGRRGSGASHPGRRCLADWIGGHAASWTESELVSMLTQPGQVEDVTVRLQRGCDDSPEEAAEPGTEVCGVPTWEADYDFHYRITRLADREVFNSDIFE